MSGCIRLGYVIQVGGWVDRFGMNVLNENSIGWVRLGRVRWG
jgi:hypothetical protein